jgi:hypothetical protein
MDVNDPASSPSGAHFIPQLPPLGTEPIRPFLDSLELELNFIFEMALIGKCFYLVDELK